MNTTAHLIVEKIKDLMEAPATAIAAASSLSTMGALDIAYRVTQDSLGILSLLIGVLIGLVVLKTHRTKQKASDIDLAIAELKLRRERMIDMQYEENKKDFHAAE
jgi:hypothetical protein